MRFFRALLLSAIYAFLVSFQWKAIGDWLVLHVSPGRVPYTRLLVSDNIIVYLNVLAFALTLLWVTRTRNLAPVARYLVPTVLGAGLTFVVASVVILLTDLIPAPGPVPGLPPGSLLIFFTEMIVPGLLAGQLLRFPRQTLTHSLQQSDGG